MFTFKFVFYLQTFTNIYNYKKYYLHTIIILKYSHIKNNLLFALIRKRCLIVDEPYYSR